MPEQKIIILGGGLSGLAAGEILSKRFKVTILEKDSFLGGLASNFEHNGRMIPRYYHHIIKSNKTTQKYLWEFGEVRELAWKKIKLAIGLHGKLYNINELGGLLRFNHLTFYEKMRFGLFGLYTLFWMNSTKIKENENAESWLHKYAGEALTKKIFYHLYSRNKFNIPLNQISAKQFAHRLHEKEIYDYFSFPKEGYQTMIEGLAGRILKNNGKIELGAVITTVNLTKKYLILSRKKIKYDLLISSIPFPEFIKVAEGLPKNLEEQLSRIKYCPAIGICFATENFLDSKNYWINLFNERVHIIMQHSLLNDEYGEKINWCLRYGGSEEDLRLSDEEIKKEYLKAVKKYFPSAKIKWARVFKTRYAEPIYDFDYSKYMPDYKTPIEGLYFTGIQLTYPKIRNMNTALNSGIKVANLVLKEYGFSQLL